MTAPPRPDASEPPPGRPEVWGILNVTPDSFSDGGLHLEAEAAVRHGLRLVAEGADVVDVGGESTRPGARPVPEEEEAGRVVPVVKALVAAGASRVSVDTRKSAVARQALEAGASIVNDVSAGRDDPALLEVAAAHGAHVVLMHMQGTPRTMQQAPRYDDVVAEVRAFLAERAACAERAGVAPERLLVDPGIGFGKTLEHNLELLRRLDELVGDGRPVLVGASRKSFLGRLTGREAPERLAASLACAARALEAGAAAVRVHDVAATVDLLGVLSRIRVERTASTA